MVNMEITQDVIWLVVTWLVVLREHSPFPSIVFNETGINQKTTNAISIATMKLANQIHRNMICLVLASWKMFLPRFFLVKYGGQVSQLKKLCPTTQDKIFLLTFFKTNKTKNEAKH